VKRVKNGRNNFRRTFEVKGVECLEPGLCSNDAIDFYKENLTEEKIDQLIADCKEGKEILQDK
jgi:NADH-quinone oxidoreductase subunit E